MDENAEKSRILTWRAAEAVKAGNLEHAEEIYRIALSLDKSSFHAYFCLSTLLVQRGDYEEAIACAAQCAILCPMEKDSWEQLVNVYNHAFENSSSTLEAKLRETLRKYQGEDFIHERQKILTIKPDDFLVRALDEQYADLLLQVGELFFRSTRYFRKLEDSDPRRDALENNPSVHEIIPTVETTMPNGWIRQETSIPGVSMTFSPDTDMQIFDHTMEIGGMDDICCFSIVSKDNIFEFLEKYDDEKLGSHAIVIKNASEFIKRIEAAFASLDNASVNTGYVTYVHEDAIENFFQPPNSCMPLNPFIKRQTYSPEFEYRLVTKSLKATAGEEGVKMHIGSIADIADKIETTKLKEWLKDRFE